MDDLSNIKEYCKKTIQKINKSPYGKATTQMIFSKNLHGNA